MVVVVLTPLPLVAPPFHPASSCLRWWFEVLWQGVVVVVVPSSARLLVLPSPRPPVSSSSRTLVPSSSCHSAAPRFHPASSCSRAWFGVPLVVVPSWSSSCCGHPSIVVILPSWSSSRCRCSPVVVIFLSSSFFRRCRPPIVVVVVPSSSSSCRRRPSSSLSRRRRCSPVSTPRAVAHGCGSGCCGGGGGCLRPCRPVVWASSSS